MRVRRIRRPKEVVRVKRREEEEHRGWWHFHENTSVPLCSLTQSDFTFHPKGKKVWEPAYTVLAHGICLHIIIKGMLMHTTVEECNPTF